MKHGSLFSGIGGFDLAAQWMGWENVFHCEKDTFGSNILRYYWPNSIHHENIIETDFSIYRGRIDILTGGFPCQPYSLSGSRKGKEDDRHLWPEYFRAIKEIQPSIVVGENVPGIVNWNGGLVFDEVQADLESAGYEVTAFVLPSCAIGATIIRERVWFLAYSNSIGRELVQTIKRVRAQKVQNTKGSWPLGEWGKQKADELDSSRNTFLQFSEMYGQPAIFDVDDGLPFDVDGISVPKWIAASFKGAGNAVDPRLVYLIYQALEESILKTYN